jgi:hypothetical protein
MDLLRKCVSSVQKNNEVTLGLANIGKIGHSSSRQGKLNLCFVSEELYVS